MILMKKLVSLILITLLACLPALAFCEEIPDFAALMRQNQITVVGSAFVRVEPDCADIYLGVDTYDAKFENALQKNESVVQAVEEAMSALGLDAGNVFTTKREETTVYGTPENATTAARIRGYRINQAITVHTNDVSKISEIISKALEAGIATVDGVIYGCADANAAYDEALSLAIQEATRKAELMAKGSNAKLGEVTRVEEASDAKSSSYSGLWKMKTAGADGAQWIDLMPSGLEFTAKVTMAFKLEANQ